MMIVEIYTTIMIIFLFYLMFFFKVDEGKTTVQQCDGILDFLFQAAFNFWIAAVWPFSLWFMVFAKKKKK